MMMTMVLVLLVLLVLTIMVMSSVTTASFILFYQMCLVSCVVM